MSAPKDTASEVDHFSGQLTLAYWMTVVLCTLSLPLTGFYLLLLMGYDGSTPLPLNSLRPVLLTGVAWVTLDVLARAYRARAQRPLWYLICVLVMQALTVLSFLPSVFAGSHGSGLALACTVMACAAMGATAEITLKAVGRWR